MLQGGMLQGPGRGMTQGSAGAETICAPHIVPPKRPG